MGSVDKRDRCTTKFCQNRRKSRRLFCCKCVRRKERENNPIGYFYDLLKQNAKRRGKEFELTREQFEQFCIKTDYMARKGRMKESLTIDRIDNTKGYTIDNIRVLTNSQNVTKRNRIDYYYDGQQMVFNTVTETNDLTAVEAMWDDVPF